MIPVQRALLSVSDKSGLIEFAAFLAKRGVEVLSTGGTFRALQKAKIALTSVEEYTGSPEILGGRVKTLHPKIHGALLGRPNVKEDQAELRANEIEKIDLLVVNLYPFAQTIIENEKEKTKASFAKAIENIDIGGPAMLRAGAKNFENTVVVCDSRDYERIMKVLEKEGAVPFDLSLELATKAFAHTASYDSLIASYLQDIRKEKFPEKLTLSYERVQPLRYGENPQQEAAFYKPLIEVFREKGSAKKNWRKLQGKELSFNNMLDADAALKAVLSLPRPGLVIVKHLNPCGAALVSKEQELALVRLGKKNAKGSSDEKEEDELRDVWDEALEDAFARARSCDPASAFGGIIALRGLAHRKLALAINQNFAEIIIAEGYSPEALEIFAKKKNLRLLLYEKEDTAPPKRVMQLRNAMQGLLYQEEDSRSSKPESWKIVSKKKADPSLLEGMAFAWSMSKQIKSNAIVFCSPEESLGIGAGQMSRLDSVEIAISKAKKAGLDLQGSIVASDAFFPFRDGIDALARAGARALVQPGGSIRDEEVIAAANEHALVMAFTGTRHFLH